MSSALEDTAQRWTVRRARSVLTNSPELILPASFRHDVLEFRPCGDWHFGGSGWSGKGPTPDYSSVCEGERDFVQRRPSSVDREQSALGALQPIGHNHCEWLEHGFSTVRA
jgi:hypothetical protein